MFPYFLIIRSKDGIIVKFISCIYPNYLDLLLRDYFCIFFFKGDEIIICDSWKSVTAIPNKFKRIVFLAHGQEYLKDEKKHNIIQNVFNRSSAIVSSSNFTLNLISSQWEVKTENCHIVYPCYSVINSSYIKKTTDENLIKLLSVCRIEKRKGLLEFSQLVSNLKAQLPNFIWHIAGNGPQFYELKDYIYSSNLRENIVFEGFIDKEKKESLLYDANLFVMPSYRDSHSIEGFGISYVEAANYAIPSIAGLSGGAPEAVLNGVSGWCVDVHNKSQTKKIILEAFCNHKKRTLFGQNAKQ